MCLDVYNDEAIEEKYQELLIVLLKERRQHNQDIRSLSDRLSKSEAQYAKLEAEYNQLKAELEAFKNEMRGIVQGQAQSILALQKDNAELRLVVAEQSTKTGARA